MDFANPNLQTTLCSRNPKIAEKSCEPSEVQGERARGMAAYSQHRLGLIIASTPIALNFSHSINYG